MSDFILKAIAPTSPSIDKVFDSISGYAVSGKASDAAYNGLRDQAALSFTLFADPTLAAEDFASDCRSAEDEFMSVNYASDANAKHTSGKKQGEWKYRTYLPQAYNSAKSALIKAMEAGINPANKGKTALDKARAEKTSKPRSPEERIESALTTIINAIAEMSADTAETAREDIKRRLAL